MSTTIFHRNLTYNSLIILKIQTSPRKRISKLLHCDDQPERRCKSLKTILYLSLNKQISSKQSFNMLALFLWQGVSIVSKGTNVLVQDMILSTHHGYVCHERSDSIIFLLRKCYLSKTNNHIYSQNPYFWKVYFPECNFLWLQYTSFIFYKIVCQ